MKTDWLAVLDGLWKEGNLRGLLYPHQIKLYDSFYRNNGRFEVFHCSRRLGKSVTLCILAIEQMRRVPGSIVRYGAAAQKDVREIILPLMRILTETCPEAYRPKWSDSKLKFICPDNNSEMVVSGLDKSGADNLRGTAMHLGIIDEAGFVDDLDYAYRSVLLPQLITTNGRMIFSSTSPRTPSHPFVHFIERAKDNDCYTQMTIYEDSRAEVLERIEEWREESGGEDSTTWKREYLCQIITDEESSLFPEFTDDKQQEILQIPEIPPYYFPYVVADLGFIDYTGVVIGYADYKGGRKVILDEVLVNRKDTKTIAGLIMEKVKLHFDNAPHELQFYADAPLLNIADFNALDHGLNAQTVPQDTVESYVNRMRLDIKSGSLVIHPRCKDTIRHLKYAVWDKNHRKIDRSDLNFGHYDLAAAAMYFSGLCDLSADPYPLHYGFNREKQFMRDKNKDRREHEYLKTAFNLEGVVSNDDESGIY